MGRETENEEYSNSVDFGYTADRSDASSPNSDAQFWAAVESYARQVEDWPSWKTHGWDVTDRKDSEEHRSSWEFGC